MKIYKYILLNILLIVSYSSIAQTEETTMQESDTTKEQPKEIYKWSYNATQTERVRVYIDTLVDFFHLYEPNGSLADYKVNIAEYASPAFSLIFMPQNKEPLFLKQYESSLISVNDLSDYTAQRPFSILSYSQGLNNEQAAQFTHTQNVNKYFNLGFNLNFYKTIGEYDNQTIKGQQITPWIVYKGPRFSTSFKYAYNNIDRQENGGIVNDTLLYYENSIRMKYTKASSKLRYQDMEFVQKWNLGKTPREDSTSLQVLKYDVALGYKFTFSSAKRYYWDNSVDSVFYQNVFWNKDKTTDSIVYKIMENIVFTEIQKDISFVNIVADIAIGSERESLEYHDYNYSIPSFFSDRIFYDGTFDIGFKSSRWKLSHHHRFYFESEKEMNMHSELSIDMQELNPRGIEFSLTHDYISECANVMYDNYLSNHYSWQNNFDAEHLHDVGGYLNSSFGNISADIHYYLLNDYIAFDNKGILHQSDENGTSFTAFVKKDTRFWHILMQNGILYQSVSVAEQEYPNWATYNMIQFQGTVFRKLVHLGIGAEMLYYPAYKVPTYDAVLGTFIPQSEYEYGDFPLINAFVTIQYKPIRLFAKYTGLYSLLNGQNYAIASYPQSNGTISFGISWLFYN